MFTLSYVHVLVATKPVDEFGFCLLLHIHDRSTADGGAERTIMPTSELKAQWPRQYIAYLEAKVVFAAEDGAAPPATGEEGEAG